MRTNGSHFSGTASSGVIASTGHSGSHAPQSMHSSGSMTSMHAPSWMQSTGQTSMHDLSLMSMHGSLITYVMPSRSDHGETGAAVAEAHLEVEPEQLGKSVGVVAADPAVVHGCDDVCEPEAAILVLDHREDGLGLGACHLGGLADDADPVTHGDPRSMRAARARGRRSR